MKILLISNREWELVLQSPTPITEFDFHSTTDSKSEGMFCEYLYDDFQRIYGSSSKGLEVSLTLREEDKKQEFIDVEGDSEQDSEDDDDEVTQVKKDTISRVILRLRDPSGILKTLKSQVLLDDNVRVQVALQMLQYGTITRFPNGSDLNRLRALEPTWITSKGMMVKDNVEYVCEDDHAISSPEINKLLLERKWDFCGRITIFIKTSKDTLPNEMTKTS